MILKLQTNSWIQRFSSHFIENEQLKRNIQVWEFGKHLSSSFPRGIFFSASIQSRDLPTNTFCRTVSQICQIFLLKFKILNSPIHPTDIDIQTEMSAIMVVVKGNNESLDEPIVFVSHPGKPFREPAHLHQYMNGNVSNRHCIHYLLLKDLKNKS